MTASSTVHPSTTIHQPQVELGAVVSWDPRGEVVLGDPLSSSDLFERFSLIGEGEGVNTKRR
jgi:hypothetical protein